MNACSALAVYVVTLLVLFAIARRESQLVRLVKPMVIGPMACGFGIVALSALQNADVSLGTASALACLVVCAASDLATGLVFDAVTATAACGIALEKLLQHEAAAATLGAAACGAAVLVLYAITRGRGIGLGDVKLAGIIGAGIGGLESLGAIGAAFVTGALCCLPLVVARRIRRGDRVAFAPYMAVGTIAVVAMRLVNGHG